jgi:hypothetical protein
VFRSTLKIFHPVTSDVWHMHGVLNVDKKITNYIDWDKFARRFFKPNPWFDNVVLQ